MQIEPTEAEMCAELARAMGWTARLLTDVFPAAGVKTFTLFSPDGAPRVMRARTAEDAWRYAPDPFTDAAASRALVEWMAADDVRWTDFYAWFVVERLSLHHPDCDSPVNAVREIMTAPLPTIARAAYEAIREKK